MSNTTTNERSKKSDIMHYLSKKIEFLEDWKIDPQKIKTLNPREKSIFGVNEQWTLT